MVDGGDEGPTAHFGPRAPHWLSFNTFLKLLQFVKQTPFIIYLHSFDLLNR